MPRRPGGRPSFSVLVAAEHGWHKRAKPSITADTTATETATLGQVVLHLDGRFLSRSSGSNDLDATEAVSPFTTEAGTRTTGLANSCKAVLPSGDVCDISEVVTVASAAHDSPGCTDSPISQNSRYGSDLAPLASEAFKEELYTRGYLKRPPGRPSIVVERKPRINIVVVSRKIFPKVLGRRQGRKIAQCLKVGQHAAETPGGLDDRFTEKQLSTSVASVTPQTPLAQGLESPGLVTNTSASESFNLHEFSYITAFTTPPSSPSIVLDTEPFEKGVKLGGINHAA